METAIKGDCVTGFFGGSKSRATWADTDIALVQLKRWVCHSVELPYSLFSFFGVGKCSRQYGHRGM